MLSLDVLCTNFSFWYHPRTKESESGHGLDLYIFRDFLEICAFSTNTFSRDGIWLIESQLKFKVNFSLFMYCGFSVSSKSLLPMIVKDDCLRYPLLFIGFPFLVVGSFLINIIYS